MSTRELELQALGVRLPGIEVGPADAKEAIVLLHGHPGSSRDWAQLVPRLGRFARTVAFDLPGLGRAEKPVDWDYGMGMYATTVAAVLDQLGIERAHLVMHDLGGGAGLLWAAAHPDSFGSAVIMGTGVLIDYKWHLLAALQRRPLLGPLMVRTTTERFFRQALRRTHSRGPGLPEWFLDQLWEDYDLRSREAMMRMYRASDPSGIERLAPLFRKLDRPALVLWGENDPFVPSEQAFRQRESFPSAEVVVLPECGHWPWIEHPEMAATYIESFFERQLAG